MSTPKNNDKNKIIIENMLSRAYHFLRFRARSIQEMKVFLHKKAADFGYNPSIVNEVIETLKKQQYLNDEEFSQMFISSRIHRNPKGKYVLSKELAQKGVSQETITKTINTIGVNEEELARKALSHKLTIWSNISKDRKKARAFAYLGRRGFPFDIIRKIVDEELKN